MVFFPRPGVHYRVGVSHKIIDDIGSYTISAVNDGTPVAISLGRPQHPERRARTIQRGLVDDGQRAGDSLLLEIASVEMSVWGLNIATPPPGK
jgi:hypothetical protein